MFNYSSSSTIIPSLVFTKAELVYAVSILLANIPPTDNETRIEMVELRHYLTLIKDRVAKAAQDGTLKRAMAASSQDIGNDTPQTTKAAQMPSIDELRLKFPTLSDEEILEVLGNERKEAIGEKREKPNSPPPPPSFIARPIADERPTTPQIPMTKKQIADKENSRKFSLLLGGKA